VGKPAASKFITNSLPYVRLTLLVFLRIPRALFTFFSAMAGTFIAFRQLEFLTCAKR
jgi:hypothetical protein